MMATLCGSAISSANALACPIVAAPQHFTSLPQCSVLPQVEPWKCRRRPYFGVTATRFVDERRTLYRRAASGESCTRLIHAHDRGLGACTRRRAQADVTRARQGDAGDTIGFAVVVWGCSLTSRKARCARSCPKARRAQKNVQPDCAQHVPRSETRTVLIRYLTRQKRQRG
jgi:hypothetical protein